MLSVKEGKSDWWIMYFDSVAHICGNKADAMIISPNKKQYLVKLQFGVQ